MGAIATDFVPAVSPIKSIQRGDVLFNITTTTHTETVTITSVDMSKTVVHFLTAVAESSAQLRVFTLGARLTSPTVLTLKQEGGFYARTVGISYEVIEYV